MRNTLILAATILFSVALLACSSNNNSTPTATATSAVTTAPSSTSGSPSASGATPSGTVSPNSLNSVDGVRRLVAGMTGVDPQIVKNVQFNNNTLTIQLNQDESFTRSHDIGSMCKDISGAVGSTNLSVVIESSTGSQLAACSTSG